MTFTWKNGRELATLSKDGVSTTYQYDGNSIRTKKTVGGVTTEYYLNGDTMMAEKKGSNLITYLFDENGDRYGLLYNSTPYYYVYNGQGDVIRLVNASGSVVAKYEYNAWGKMLAVTNASGTVQTSSTFIGNINPIRYRGYYYDSETGFYYLQSRYYDPEIGRFINADDVAMLGLIPENVLSNNLFAYCTNNPAMNEDPYGYIAANVVGAAIGVVIGIVGGVFLGNWLADILKLRGIPRMLFVGGVSALVGAAAGAIGYFIGPYVAKITVKLGQYVAQLIKKGKIAIKKLSANAKSSIRTLLKESCCFVAGTPISTPDGERPIENIRIGDSVYAENPETGQVGVKKVTDVFVRETATLYHILTETEEIVTTDEHPFWVEDSGWTEAHDLIPGNVLRLQNSKNTVVCKTFIEYVDKPVYVYNFEVEDWHTYFVGSDQVLVHNKCSLTKINDSYLKRKGIDAHSIKREYVGKNEISKFDMYYDKNSGIIFLLRKGAKVTQAIATTYCIK